MKNMFITSKTLFAVLIAAGLTFSATSCKKDSSTSTTDTVTEADAAELTTDAVSPETGGMTAQLSSSVTIEKTVALSCGVQKDSTIIKSSATGASPIYNYNLSWNYILTCNGLIPSQLAFNFSGTGSYDGPRLSSTDKSNGSFTLTGLQAASSQYLFSSTYSRTGTTVSKIARQYTFTSDIKITSSNIAIDKVTQQIVSGTGTVVIKATSSSGKTFNFTGTLTFLGGKKATVVLNSGATYTIQWS
ncbi:hypothetical protein KXD93_01425 [Mucilaginibacter sp. BJC16-A38]|uniref:hypothetical protein n=1 Tax=Mucilaginibacter phenanthrenivorans TaxID=1234842 RepID=UPI002157C6DC|nr:hypothetical protein [Mucilaginibacter phenanthrenivorans]MCR8556281.1 hypothetical protein [Mucilaginibacter phenanthrenivorans]